MLKGERVILRAIERDDLKALHALACNVELMLLGYGTWEPVPLAKREKNFDKYLDGHEHSWFAIDVDGTLIGDCGLHHSERRDSSTQFGIGIYHPDYVDKGYGPDAIVTLLRWTFQIQNWRRVWLETLADNARAIHVYHKLGFVEEGRLREHAFFDGRYVDVVQMGMLRSEWAAREQ